MIVVTVVTADDTGVRQRLDDSVAEGRSDERDRNEKKTTGPVRFGHNRGFRFAEIETLRTNGPANTITGVTIRGSRQRARD